MEVNYDVPNGNVIVCNCKEKKKEFPIKYKSNVNADFHAVAIKMIAPKL